MSQVQGESVHAHCCQSLHDSNKAVPQTPEYDAEIDKPLAQGYESLICALRGDSERVVKLVRHDTNEKTKRAMHNLACVTLGGEYKIVQTLDHAHVLKMTDFSDGVTLAGKSYCAAVMPRMKSDFLATFACASAPRPDDTVAALAKIVSAVQYVHSKNLAHNDLKPENFFLRADGEAFLGDFGAAIAQDYGNYFQQKNLWEMRNLHYAPPEIFALKLGTLKAVVDERRADMYSLGQSLFMCVFCCDPRVDEKPPETSPVHKFIVENDVEGFWSFISEFCTAILPVWGEDRLKCALDLVVRMMAPDPEKRLTAEEVLKHPFFAQGA